MIITAVLSWRGGQILLDGIFIEMASPPEVPPAFSEPPDPPSLKLCRPCSEKSVIEHVGYYGVKTTERALIHACDGGTCECPLCDIARTAQEMTDYEKFMDRVDGWRD